MNEGNERRAPRETRTHEQIEGEERAGWGRVVAHGGLFDRIALAVEHMAFQMERIADGVSIIAMGGRSQVFDVRREDYPARPALDAMAPGDRKVTDPRPRPASDRPGAPAPASSSTAERPDDTASSSTPPR